MIAGLQMRLYIALHLQPFFLFLGVVQFMVLRICIYNKIPTFRYCEKHKTMIPLFIEIQRVILLNRQVVKQ